MVPSTTQQVSSGIDVGFYKDEVRCAGRIFRRLAVATTAEVLAKCMRQKKESPDFLERMAKSVRRDFFLEVFWHEVLWFAPRSSSKKFVIVLLIRKNGNGYERVRLPPDAVIVAGSWVVCPETE